VTSRPDAPVESPGRPAAGAGAADLGALLPAYRVPDGHFDELLQPGRALRAHWQSFAAHAGSLSAARLERARARVARQIHENGVTYTVYAAATPARPWGLDVLPLIMGSVEWETLARGLRQRARLLDAMATDLYGPQRLLAEGLIPSALVLAQPGFLRACHGVSPPLGVRLHQLAFDLARGPDGQWRVVGTRAQAPSGAGYALENRLTISRLFPEAFREQRVQVLAQFFRGLQDNLLGGAPVEAGEAPHIALLTPGPYSETYFEHAYLARYLGFALVEGGDLAVRDNRVYLKTVTGLQRVHAILRRLDDTFCDPLELRADSALGVPGLLGAWRAGHVLVANAFGTGILESPALTSFLPAVCPALLGETLALPSVPTWWCGEAAALAEAGPRIAQMVVKPAFPDARAEPVFGAELDEAGRARWSGRVRAAPERYVLQEYLPLSHGPVWHGGRLESRALMLRVFLVADGRGDFRVMPGGLSRIAGDDRQVVSGHRGGSSKDTWVLSDAPIEVFSLLPGRLGPDDVARSQRIVSSRAGENLFWLGRYAERSENDARLLRAVLRHLPDHDAFPPALSRPVVRTCQRHGLLPAGLPGYARTPRRLGADLIARVYERRRGGGLAFDVEQTRRVAAAVRDRLSPDNWRLVNQLFEAFAEPAASAGLADLLELVDRTIVTLVAIGGLEMEHMTRDDGWRFLSIGRHVERLHAVATTVAEVVASEESEQPALLEWLLDLADSTITYRARYMRQPEWLAVADLLLFDRRNPRSAAYQLTKLAKHVALLPEADLPDLIAEVAEALAAARGAEAAPGAPATSLRDIGDFLARAAAVSRRLSDALTLRYFSHVYEPTQATAAI
jgi:uncharacterized circularly permuted ATP-grasp superfamily protein/uncharacterized alpha-E superfamily protein